MTIEMGQVGNQGKASSQAVHCVWEEDSLTDG